MNNIDFNMEREIKLHALKTLIKLILCLCFLIGAIYILFYGGTNTLVFFRNVYLVKLYGFIGIIIFAYFTYNFFRIYRYRNKAVIITSEGIFNKTSSFYSGLIKWKDITDIKKVKYRSNNMIVITVKNEEDYLSKVSSRFRKFISRQNSTILGSFIFMVSDDLIGFRSDDELESYLKEQLKIFQ